MALLGVVAAFVGTGAISALSGVTELEGKPGPAALYLLVVLIATAVGGFWAGLAASVAAFLEYRYFYVTPTRSLAVTGSSIVALGAFLTAALLSSYLLQARRALAQLRASRQTLDLALQSSAMGSWEWQPATDRLSLSEEAERLLGLEAGTFSGGTEALLRMVHPDDRERVAASFEQAMKSTNPLEVDLRFVRHDGVVLWLDVRGRVIRGPSYAATTVVGVFVDVTRLQEEASAYWQQLAELSQEHSLLSAVIEQMPTGVIIAEAPSGRILVSNKQFDRLWGEPLRRASNFSEYREFRGFYPNGRAYGPEDWPLARAIMRGERTVSQRIEIEPPAGTRKTVESSATPIRDETGRIVAGITSIVDVTDRIRTEQEQRFLADGSAILSSSLDYEETLARVARLAVPALADWCSIDLVFGDGSIRNVGVAHVDPEKVGLVRRLQTEYVLDREAPAGAPAVIRTGRSQLYSEITDELLAAAALDECQLQIVRDLGVRSAITAPLTTGGRTLGAISFVIVESERRYTESDLALVEEIARRAATAVDNARLYAEQTNARNQAEEAWAQTSRLQAVTAALSEAVTSTEVAEVIVREGMVAFRAHAAAVVRLGSGGTEFQVLASTGFPDSVSGRSAVYPADVAGPSEEAVRTRHLVVTESAEELATRWPHLAESQVESGLSANIAAPLLVEGEPVGVLHMAFRAARTFDDSTREFLVTMARRCAQALERARLLEAERAARDHAERLTNRLRRLQLIVDATLAGGSADELIHGLLDKLRDAVGSDTGTILVVDESGEALREFASIGFGEPDDVPVPFGHGFAGGIAASQLPAVVPDVSQIELVSPYLRQSGIVSLAGVPLLVEGRTVGVLHVGTRGSHGFEREDLLILRLAASRVAAALERARAQELEHRIAETLHRSLLPGALPAAPGIEAAARYVPATLGVTVGGDWYDAFELEDGSIGIAVGDVVGHGVAAAAAMGRLRDVLRAYATDGFGPADTLSRLNKMACREGDDVFATVVYVIVNPGRTDLRMASAGHPPPLLRRPGGLVTRLEDGRSLPIGASAEAVYHQVAIPIEAGSLLVLYTDGLVERRHESIDIGIDRLASCVEAGPSRVAELADTIIDALADPDHRDDVVLVAVAVNEVPSPRLSLQLPAAPRSLAAMRAEMRPWLESLGAEGDEIFDILVAVNEACSNAIEHPLGVQGPGAHVVDIDAEVVSGEVSIVVRDSGRWRHRGPREDRGRGMEFMEALMEGVEVTRLPEGTTVRLRRRLRVSRAPKVGP